MLLDNIVSNMHIQIVSIAYQPSSHTVQKLIVVEANEPLHSPPEEMPGKVMELSHLLHR